MYYSYSCYPIAGIFDSASVHKIHILSHTCKQYPVPAQCLYFCRILLPLSFQALYVILLQRIFYAEPDYGIMQQFRCILVLRIDNQIIDKISVYAQQRRCIKYCADANIKISFP